MPNGQTRKNLKQETLKKISLEKLPRILLETKKQKNPKISMRKTHTFLEKLAPRTSDRGIQLGIGIRYIVGVIAIILPQQLIRGQIGIILMCHHQVCIPWMNHVLKHVTQKLVVDTVTWERNIGLYTILNIVSHYYFRWWWEWEKVSDCKYERKNSGGRETLT